MRVDREEHLAFIVDFSLKHSEKSAFLFFRCFRLPWSTFFIYHCKTQWSNIIFAKQMHHIAVGDASFDKLTVL